MQSAGSSDEECVIQEEQDHMSRYSGCMYTNININWHTFRQTDRQTHIQSDRQLAHTDRVVVQGAIYVGGTNGRERHVN